MNTVDVATPIAKSTPNLVLVRVHEDRDEVVAGERRPVREVEDPGDVSVVVVRDLDLREVGAGAAVSRRIREARVVRCACPCGAEDQQANGNGKQHDSAAHS
jgi:hypothetical protein